jgi:hypothetical protein
MTSSFVLKKLGENKSEFSPAYTSLSTSTLGGIEDRHLKLHGECHPDFVTVPIGNPQGAKLCIRRTDQCGRNIGNTPLIASEAVIENSQGYHRGSVNLYNPKQDLPTQKWNPQFYSSRRTPHEQDLIRSDTWRMPIKFSGTGIKTLRTPAQLRDSGKPYMEYAYSFTPDEDPETGMRTASSWSQTKPEIKYDVTRLHQAYPVWKREHEHMGHPQDALDTTYFKRIV